MIGEYAANILIGYLAGSVPVGLVIGYLWTREDIRTRGSGKTGTTNVFRTAGPIPAALAVVLDISKGIAPAVIGRFVFDDAGVAAAGAAASIVGHVYPVFAGFRGGRGVAAAFGGILGLAPLIALLFPLLGALVVVPTRIVSLMSVVATPICSIIIVVGAFAGWWEGAYGYYAAFAGLAILYTHIPNIRRLLAGTEPRWGSGGDQPATG